MGPDRTLRRSFFARDARVVAPELLNKVLVHGARRARLVEVEAYVGSIDPGSHSFRGETPRTKVMFGPAGHLYVYFTYGIHWCANAVCGAVGEGTAVLLRAAEPLAGLDEMWRLRATARTERDLCRGPARLCQAFGLSGDHNGLDVVGARAVVQIVDDGVPPPDDPGVSTRGGLTAGSDLPWRWYLARSRFVSR